MQHDAAEMLYFLGQIYSEVSVIWAAEKIKQSEKKYRSFFKIIFMKFFGQIQ